MRAASGCAMTARIEIVILEGVYAARPELADLLDLRVMLAVPDEVRTARLMAREGTIGPWEQQWHDSEDSISDTLCRPIASTRSQSFAHDCR
jgi:uridine kinase